MPHPLSNPLCCMRERKSKEILIIFGIYLCFVRFLLVFEIFKDFETLF